LFSLLQCLLSVCLHVHKKKQALCEEESTRMNHQPPWTEDSCHRNQVWLLYQVAPKSVQLQSCEAVPSVF
jgi:hypothetical protein